MSFQINTSFLLAN